MTVKYTASMKNSNEQYHHIDHVDVFVFIGKHYIYRFIYGNVDFPFPNTLLILPNFKNDLIFQKLDW